MSEDRAVELVSCPHCGHVASVEWSRNVHGVVYLKIRCIARHWFLMPDEAVTYHASDNRYTAGGHVSQLGPGNANLPHSTPVTRSEEGSS